MLIDQLTARRWDDVREIIIPGDHQRSLTYCTEHWINAAKKAIRDHDAFYVALSGGSTPKAIFEQLTSLPYVEMIEWKKVHLFWSDERSVPAHHPDSNYHMAMQAGFLKMPIPSHQIHRMIAEKEIEKNALAYEKTLEQILGKRPMDLIMLGMGEDGHTASLFPHTEGVHAIGRKIIANFIPQKNTWRMSMTFDYLNSSSQKVVYVLGESKAKTLSQALLFPRKTEEFPVLKVGTAKLPALWIVDEAAAKELIRERSP